MEKRLYAMKHYDLLKLVLDEKIFFNVKKQKDLENEID